MDKSTEYCSFVSVDYIICECGDTFPNEEALKDHLDNDHYNKSAKPPSLFDNFIDNKNFKKEPKQQGDKSHTEYYLQNAPNCEPVQLILPEGIKQESEVILQYVDHDDSYVEQDYTYVEQEDEYLHDSNEVVIKEEPEPEPFASKQVTFKKEQIADEVVILAQENEEHDYDREAEKPFVQEYYFCETCGKAFMSERSVKVHVKVMHCSDKQKSKNSVCDMCGKKYAMWQRTCSGCGAKRAAARPSQQSKGPAKPKNLIRFTCDVCGVGRSSNAALRYHQRVHTGERPYKCNMCPKAFTMPLFLQLHIRTHTGERPYQCQECPKAFSNQAALVRHSRVHTGIKPYACPECGKAFTQSNSMKLHYQTVHLRMPAPYKSQARKLRDMQKVVLLQEPNRKTKKVKESEPEQTDAEPRNNLLFRHGYHRREPEYDYVVEQVHCIVDNVDNEYEDVYIPVK